MEQSIFYSFALVILKIGDFILVLDCAESKFILNVVYLLIYLIGSKPIVSLKILLLMLALIFWLSDIRFSTNNHVVNIFP